MKEHLCPVADVLTPLYMSFLSACHSLAVPLKPSKWVQTHWSGERAILTLVHLNKEDEGMYTLRVNTKSGFDTYSAYVFVRGNHPGNTDNIPGKASDEPSTY